MTSLEVPELAGEPPPSPASSTAAHRRALSEVTLVARAQDGDLAAYEDLVRLYQADLFRLGYRMVGDRGDAQDAFVLVWRRLPSLADPQTFRAWVYQLMTRQCLSLLRRRARRRTVVAAPESGSLLENGIGIGVGSTPAADPESVAEEVALVDDLRVALTRLPDELRVCWVLKELHEMTYPEIAYAVGVPVSTVRGRIARARARLARGMAAWR